MTKMPNHSLYQRPYCFYCLKVRTALKLMKVELALLNISKDKHAFNALVNEGGKKMVPCLRIERDDGSVEWMYESNDIIKYIKTRIAP